MAKQIHKIPQFRTHTRARAYGVRDYEMILNVHRRFS